MNGGLSVGDLAIDGLALCSRPGRWCEERLNGCEKVCEASELRAYPAHVVASATAAVKGGFLIDVKGHPYSQP